jgi:hypothetical protein
VTVNFVNADIEAVTRAFAAMIERQIAVDPRVKGTMTVYSEQPQSVAQAYQSYLSALRGLGFAVVDNGGLLKVVPEADAKLQTSTVSIGEVAVKGDQVITQIFPLRYENPNNLVAVLRPLISANNTINANPASGTLVITDYAENPAAHRPHHRGTRPAGLHRHRDRDAEALGGLRPRAAGAAAGQRQRRRGARHRGRRPGDGACRAAQQRADGACTERGPPGRSAGADRQARQAQRGHGLRGHVGGAPEECRRRPAGHGAARRLPALDGQHVGGSGHADTGHDGAARGRRPAGAHGRLRRLGAGHRADHRGGPSRPPAATSRPTRRPIP